MNKLNNLLCQLFGHKYRKKRKITNSIYELNCKRCKKEFVINSWVETVLPLDDELRLLHEEFLKNE